MIITGLVTCSLPSEIPFERIYIQNHFHQTSPREDSSLLFCPLLDFTLFPVGGFWTVGFPEFGGRLMKDSGDDLAMQLPLSGEQQWQLGKDKSVFQWEHGECQADAEGSPSKRSWISCYLCFHTNFPKDSKDVWNYLRVLTFRNMISSMLWRRINTMMVKHSSERNDYKVSFWLNPKVLRLVKCVWLHLDCTCWFPAKDKVLRWHRVCTEVWMTEMFVLHVLFSPQNILNHKK